MGMRIDQSRQHSQSRRIDDLVRITAHRFDDDTIFNQDVLFNFLQTDRIDDTSAGYFDFHQPFLLAESRYRIAILTATPLVTCSLITDCEPS